MEDGRWPGAGGAWEPAKGSDLTAVGDLIDQVLARVARADVAPIVSLRRHWEVVAGDWAGRCRPVGLVGGVLTVEVSTGMDASMLRFSTQDLVEGVRNHLGADPSVDRVVIRIARTPS